MDSSASMPASGRVPLSEFCPDLVDDTPPRFFPTIFWGYFEVEDDADDVEWIERVTEDASYSAIFGQVSGFLVETEADNSWIDDDSVATVEGAWGDLSDGSLGDDDESPVPDGSDALDVLTQEAWGSLAALRVHPVPDGCRLTGRYLAIVSDDHPAESGNVELLTQDVSDEEVEGILRVAQSRFAETLSCSPFEEDPENDGPTGGSEVDPVAEAEISVLVDLESSARTAPPLTTVGDLFSGWQFLPLPDDLDAVEIWAFVETIDGNGDTMWHTRRTSGVDENVLTGALSRRVFELEARIIDSFDKEEGLPDRVGRPPLLELTTLVNDTKESAHARSSGRGGCAEAAAGSGTNCSAPGFPRAPLPSAVASLPTRDLPAGETAIIATIYWFGTRPDGHTGVVYSYEFNPEPSVYGDLLPEELEVTDFEELGLLRSALRDTIRFGIGRL